MLSGSVTSWVPATKRPGTVALALPKPDTASQEKHMQDLLNRVRSQPAKPKQTAPAQKSPVKSSVATPTATKQQAVKAPHPPPKALRQKGDDDVELFLSDKEADLLFEEVARQVKQDWALKEDDNEDEDWEDMVPSSLQTQPIVSAGKTTFKGFGAPPRAANAPALKPSPAPSSQNSVTQASKSTPKNNTSTAADTKPKASATQQPTSKLQVPLRHTDVPALRVFLYAAEANRTRAALQEAGWAGQVVLSEDLKSSDVVVATKEARNGKHNKLQQGSRTARNSGIPFVCVGRRMTRDNLVVALAPVMQAHRARHGVVHEEALATAIAKAGVSSEKLAQRQKEDSGKLQPGWRDRMAQELGLTEAALLASRQADVSQQQ